MKRVIEKLSNKPILFGALVSAIVFVSGFGIMLIMYNYWLHTDALIYPGLKGLFDYKASLWGDALCLPLIIGVGTTYILQFRKEVKYKNKSFLPLIIGTIGGLSGAIIQAQWIISDTTIPNWSIPTQHHFNYAGWYHAAFFVGVCFAISYIATRIVLIDLSLKPSKNQQKIEEAPKSYFYFVCQFIIWFCGLLFLHFHYLDDYSNRFSEWQIIGFISLIGAVILFGAKIIINKTKRFQYYSPVLFAVAISTLVSIVMSSISNQNLPQCDWWLLIAGILCTSLYIYNGENKTKMVGLFLLFAVFECLCQVIIYENLVQKNYLQSIVFFVLCVSVPSIISIIDYQLFEKNNPYDNRKHVKAIIVALLINIIPLLLSLSKSARELKELVFDLSSILDLTYGLSSLVIFFLLEPYIRWTFGRIQNMEYGTEYSTKQVEEAKRFQYLIYTCVYASSIILLLNSLALDLSFKNGLTTQSNWGPLLVITLLIAVCCLVIKLVNIEKTYIGLLQFSYVLLVLYLLYASVPLKNATTNEYLWIKILLVVFISCGMSVFIALSILYNVALLRQRIIMSGVATSAIVIGILGGISYGLATYQFLIFQNVFYAVQLFLVTVVAFVVLPFIQSSKLNDAGNIGILKNYACSGVMQDGFLFSTTGSVNIVITVKILQMVPHDYAGALGLFIVYSLNVVVLCDYCIKNNEKHCIKMKEALEKELKKQSVENQEILNNQYENLETWLTMQNRLAKAIAFPYSWCYATIRWIRSWLKN